MSIRRTWLPFLNADIPAACDTPARTAAFELDLGCRTLGIEPPALSVMSAMGEDYEITDAGITGGKTGLLYGVYAYLCAKAAGEQPPAGP